MGSGRAGLIGHVPGSGVIVPARQDGGLEIETMAIAAGSGLGIETTATARASDLGVTVPHPQRQGSDLGATVPHPQRQALDLGVTVLHPQRQALDLGVTVLHPQGQRLAVEATVRRKARTTKSRAPASCRSCGARWFDQFKLHAAL